MIIVIFFRGYYYLKQFIDQCQQSSELVPLYGLVVIDKILDKDN